MTHFIFPFKTGEANHELQLVNAVEVPCWGKQTWLDPLHRQTGSYFLCISLYVSRDFQQFFYIWGNYSSGRKENRIIEDFFCAECKPNKSCSIYCLNVFHVEPIIPFLIKGDNETFFPVHPTAADPPFGAAFLFEPRESCHQ